VFSSTLQILVRKSVSRLQRLIYFRIRRTKGGYKGSIFEQMGFAIEDVNSTMMQCFIFYTPNSSFIAYLINVSICGSLNDIYLIYLFLSFYEFNLSKSNILYNDL
jgi:hypothetical protein